MSRREIPPRRYSAAGRQGTTAGRWCSINQLDGGNIPVTSPEEQLLDIWARLAAGERATLLAFAEFLEQRGTRPEVRPPGVVPREIPPPEAIERPSQESVVAALKRLARTYPMLDKSAMLGATSDLVARHIMQGTDAGPVIDELEAIFSEQYRQLRDSHSG